MKNKRRLLRDACRGYTLSLLMRLLSKWLKPCCATPVRAEVAHFTFVLLLARVIWQTCKDLFEQAGMLVKQPRMLIEYLSMLV